MSSGKASAFMHGMVPFAPSAALIGDLPPASPPAPASLGNDQPASSNSVGALPFAPPVIRPSELHDRDGGAGLRAFLLHSYKIGKMDARELMSLAWFAVKAGAEGVSDLALDPCRHDHAEVLRERLGTNSTRAFFTVPVSMYDKELDDRGRLPFPVNLPHEHFAWLYEQDPSDFLVESADGDLPDTYWNHPVQRRAKSKAVPLGFFSDGVPHTKKDGL